VFCLLALLVPILPVQAAQAASLPSGAAQTTGSPSSFASAMQAAAQARQVPLVLIEATAYVNTRWEWIATPAHDGGVGPMNVKPSQMSLALSLSGHSASQIASDLAANFDAGAALLAHYHSGGSDPSSWQSAVTTTQGAFVEGEIFDVLRTGATRTTSTGETITLDSQPLSSGTKTDTSSSGSTGAASAAGVAGAAPTATSSSDYPSAAWVPADPSNYSVANRPHDYPVDMIIIHDIEGSYGSAIQDFQTPGYAASANYVVSYQGQIAQMVQEKDIAWHAGNWDYNTRAIGIEHEGFAAYNLYTTAEYNASAALAASICSRWGVPMDRNHVIGHYQVPDPNNPGLYGGVDHHTDPGPYWNWTYYMNQAVADTKSLPSPPRMMPDPVATSGQTSATVAWQPARTCRVADAPITGYTVVGQPGNLTINLPATATSATFNGLQPGTTYTFTVTATNSYGTDSLTANSVIAGSCTSAGLSANPGSPQVAGAMVQFTATSTVCLNPLYQFWILPPGGVWTVAQPYSTSATFSWDTTGKPYGAYSVAVWARDSTSPGLVTDSAGTFDARSSLQYTVMAPPCTAATAAPSPASPTMRGPAVTVTAGATGCSNQLFEFWLIPPGGVWSVVQTYSTIPTFTWSTTGRATGTYRFSVWARDAGSPGTAGAAPYTYDSFSAFDYTLTAGCPSMTASASPATSAVSGTSVTITAAPSGCPNPRYEFWLLPPGGIWAIVQPYSANATYSWSTAGRPAGSYRFSVWVRDASSGAAYDTFSAFQYALTTIQCTSMAATSTPSSSATVGSQVAITGSATGCPNPRYEFWLLAPGRTWAIAQGYSTTATYQWSTAGEPVGSYRFSVWARDASSSSSYDVFSAFQYPLTSAVPCSAMSITPSPSSPAAAGSMATITASATGCANPLYEFWFLPAGGTWTLVRGYTASATYDWNTTGEPAGTYRFSVWVRDAGSPGTNGSPPYTYDAFGAFDYTLS
jgi:hypothetical protein